MIDSAEIRRWIVAQVQTGSELSVRDRLIEQGCEVYCPAMKWTPRSRRNKDPEPRETAIMPGYLFVDHTTVHGLPDKREEVPGLHGVMTFAGRWAVLSDEALDGLRHVESLRVIGNEDLVAMPFDAGAWVKVVEGPFTGFKGQVQLALPGRVVLFGGDFTMEVDLPVEICEEAKGD